jgi:hypothetical protein
MTAVAAGSPVADASVADAFALSLSLSAARLSPADVPSDGAVDDADVRAGAPWAAAVGGNGRRMERWAASWSAAGFVRR